MDSDSSEAWGLDQSRVDAIESAATWALVDVRALYPRWTDLGLNSIDTAAHTFALALLTVFTVGLCYVAVSRGHKDSYLTLAVWVVPEWVSAATTWLTRLSSVAQDYALLGSYIRNIRTGMTTVSRCLSGEECIQGDSNARTTPLYTGHGCFGTAMLFGNDLIKEGVLCALVLFLVLPEYGSRNVIRAVVVAPFLAACTSATVHIKNTCIPPEIVLESGNRVRRAWRVFEPRDIDPTTAMFTKLSHMVAFLVLGLWTWKYRHFFIAQLSGSTEYGYKWVKPLLVMYAIPPVVFAGLQLSLDTLSRSDPRSGPLWPYVVLNTTFGLVAPLMGMWPGLVLFFQRLRMPDNILPITQARDNDVVPSGLPKDSSPTADKEDVEVDSPSFAGSDVALSDNSRIDEK